VRKLKLIGLFAIAFLSGAIVVGAWLGHQFSRLTISKQVDAAFQAAQQAEWLAQLRLGETENAIRSMENAMDVGVVAISQWAAADPPDEAARKARDGFLSNVKVYHESFPAAGKGMASALELLATVPGRRENSTCKAGICRLDDKRLANTKSKVSP